MKSRFKNKLIVLLLALVSLFVLAGCTFSQTLDEFIESEKIKVCITYYVNGGEFKGSSSVTKDLYYHNGDMPLNITESPDTADEDFSFGKGSIYITKENYVLVGWYPVTEVIDESKGLCEIGEEAFDFTKALEGGNNLITIKLAAKWQKREGVKIQLAQIVDEDLNVLTDKAIAVDSPKDYITEGKTSFVTGDLMGEIFYAKNDTLSQNGANPESMLFTVADKAYTFFDYYEDEACTTPVTWPVQRGETQTTIYARYMVGDWNYVSEDDDVRTMFNSGLKSGKNYWLKNDIDCSKITVSPISDTKGVLKGNGYTISNLKVAQTFNAGTYTVALFGAIEATAEIKDVTFENLSIEYKLGRKVDCFATIYYVFTSLNTDKIANVKIKGELSLKINQNITVTNISAENKTNYLFGGYATDEAYKTASNNQGFVVENEVVVS